MGLDIVVIENVKKVELEEDAIFTAYVIDSAWEHKIKNLEQGAKYEGDIYNTGVSYPYSYHTYFRKRLLELINRHDLIDANDQIKWEQIGKEPYFPFKELIDFADNEGCLDWETNEKLYKEFIEYDSLAKIFEDDESDFYEFYKAWREVFEIGRNKNSVVIFW